MKRLFIFILMLVPFTSIKAQYTLENFTFQPADGSVLLVGTYLEFQFDYTKPDGDIRIQFYGMYQGVGPDNIYNCPSPVYTLNQSYGGLCLTLDSPGQIDNLYYQVTDVDGVVVFKEGWIPVNYAWQNYEIFNVQFNLPSGSYLLPYETIEITFDYLKPDGVIGISAILMFSGFGVAESRFQVAGPISENVGTLNRWMYHTMQGPIDMIRVFFYDLSTSEILADFDFPIDYHYVTYHFDQFSLDPPSPSTLVPYQQITVNFDYLKIPGEVLMFACPMFQGQSLLDFSQMSGSQIVSGRTGSLSRTFNLTAPGQVDQIKIYATLNDAEQTLLYEQFIDVDYTYQGYGFSNFATQPLSPATLFTNDNVTVSFDYTIPEGEVLIHAEPMFQGQYLYGISNVSASDVITAYQGSLSRTFSLFSPGSVDQVRLLIREYTQEMTILYQEDFPVNYSFINASGVDESGSENGLSAWPNPANRFLWVELKDGREFDYEIYDLMGKIIKQGQCDGDQVAIDLDSMTPGYFILRVICKGGVINRRILKN